MEKWLFNKYETPYLDINGVEISNNKTLLINADIDNFDVEINTNYIDLQKTKEILECLKDPKSCHWTELKQSLKDKDVLHYILNSLDQYSLIFESKTQENKLMNELSTIDDFINMTTTTLLQKVKKHEYSMLQSNVSKLLETAHYLLKSLAIELDVFDLNEIQYKKIEVFDNFYLNTIAFQMKYLQRSMPLALLMWFETLYRALIEIQVDPLPTEYIKSLHLHWELLAPFWIGDIFNEKDIFIYQTCFMSHLFDSIRADRKLHLVPPQLNHKVEESLSGINFMIKMERLAEETQTFFGEAALLKNIKNDSFENKNLIFGIYIEEFHVTCRFVEIITPMLNKRLNGKLREKMFQYYQEEFGHEKFELETCLSLGIDKKELLDSYPLPLTQAYIDIFTYIADCDPIGFIVSVMITEGMFGKHSPLHDHLEPIMLNNTSYQKVARAHDNLNTALNHSSLARIFMKTISIVTPETQERAIRHCLYLLELNYRVWEQLVEYYSDQSQLRFFSWLNMLRTV
ncbi:MAG: hypothetical protein HKM04_08200 [Legionellales bacterium]|nr:hypothetical protein [Legionellales bacterium]